MSKFRGRQRMQSMWDDELITDAYVRAHQSSTVSVDAFYGQKVNETAKKILAEDVGDVTTLVYVAKEVFRAHTDNPLFKGDSPTRVNICYRIPNPAHVKTKQGEKRDNTVTDELTFTHYVWLTEWTKRGGQLEYKEIA